MNASTNIFGYKIWYQTHSTSVHQPNSSASEGSMNLTLVYSIKQQNLNVCLIVPNWDGLRDGRAGWLLIRTLPADLHINTMILTHESWKASPSFQSNCWKSGKITVRQRFLKTTRTFYKQTANSEDLLKQKLFR